MTNMQTLTEYRYALYDEVSVNDGPHLRRWSHDVIVIPRLTSDPANEDFFAVFWTRITNMDSANGCFSGYATVIPRLTSGPANEFFG